jgi:3-oxoacyl-[acyl-carrier-protein] synthase-3
MATTGSVSNVAIRGIACTVSEKCINNESYSEVYGSENVAKFMAMTGVKSRYVALPDQAASDFTFVAARQVLQKVGWGPQDVDAIIFVSQSPDYPLPATACVLHHRLEFGKNCLAFDINLGCSGFVYGLFVAASICREHSIRRVLFCGGDVSTRGVSPEDRSVEMLFGDSGFAVALEYDASAAPCHFLFKTDGSGFKHIIVPALGHRRPKGDQTIREFGEGVRRGDQHLFMNGPEVFNFTISEVPMAIKQLMASVPWTPEQADYLVLHQANFFILKNIARMTKFPMTKVPVSMDRYGNTSVSSIPITLCDAFGDRGFDATPRKIVMSGFGVGLSWGVLALELDPSVCLPISHTSDFYVDGNVEA